MLCAISFDADHEFRGRIFASCVIRLSNTVADEVKSSENENQAKKRMEHKEGTLEISKEIAHFVTKNR